MAPAGAGFRFACESGSGAVLILKDDMQREDLIKGKQINDYIRAHVESWYNFAETLDLADELRQQDLMLVTGRSTTTQWAVAAFTQKKKECAIEFHTGYGGAGAHFALAGSWANANSAEHRFGPMPARNTAQPLSSVPGDAGPSALYRTGTYLPGQTVFLRGFHVRMRLFGAPPKIWAAAEPRNNNYDPSHDYTEAEFGQSTSRLFEGTSLASESSSATDYGTESSQEDEQTVVCFTSIPERYCLSYAVKVEGTSKHSSRLYHERKIVKVHYLSKSRPSFFISFPTRGLPLQAMTTYILFLK